MGRAERVELSLPQGSYTRLIVSIRLLLQFIVTANMVEILRECFKNENKSFWNCSFIHIKSSPVVSKR